MNINKQQAQASAEFEGARRGKNAWLIRCRTLKEPDGTRNPFHRGSRCWHAYERAWRRTWLLAAQDTAFAELMSRP